MGDDFDKEGFRKAFLIANANPEFIASKFADMMREMMRAFAAGTGSSGGYRAAQNLKFILDLLAHAEELIRPDDVIYLALDNLRGPHEPDKEPDTAVEAARTGLRFLVERSCYDNAARGRTRQRLESFEAAIRGVRHRWPP